MRGSPPLHLVLFAVAFVLLAIPLSHLTFARPEPEVNPTEAQPSDKIATQLRVRFAHTPVSISIKLDGNELFTARIQDRSAASVATELTIPKEGLEFVVSVVWPEGTPDTAFTMEVEPEAMDMQSQTHWSSGSRMEEFYTYQWKL